MPDEAKSSADITRKVKLLVDTTPEPSFWAQAWKWIKKWVLAPLPAILLAVGAIYVHRFARSSPRRLSTLVETMRVYNYFTLAALNDLPPGEGGRGDVHGSGQIAHTHLGLRMEDLQHPQRVCHCLDRVFTLRLAGILRHRISPLMLHPTTLIRPLVDSPAD